MTEHIRPDDLVPQLEIDLEIAAGADHIKFDQGAGPAGAVRRGEPAPLFLLRGLQLLDFKGVGKDGKHFKAWFGSNGARLETIGFGLGNWSVRWTRSKKYDLAVELESNEYNGFETVQLSLIDIEGGGEMKILVIGSGGREHALVWKIAQSPKVTKSTARRVMPAPPSWRKISI